MGVAMRRARSGGSGGLARVLFGPAPPERRAAQLHCSLQGNTLVWLGVGVGERTSSVLSSTTAWASGSLGRRESRSLYEQQRSSCFCMARAGSTTRRDFRQEVALRKVTGSHH